MNSEGSDVSLKRASSTNGFINSYKTIKVILKKREERRKDINDDVNSKIIKQSIKSIKIEVSLIASKLQQDNDSH